MQTATVLAVLAAVVLVAGTASVDALTAFGKSTPEKDNKVPTPKVPKGRQCATNADCVGTASTTCTLDKTDGKKHCLCRDGAPPVNSKCAVVPSEPGKACSDHSDCVLGAECVATANDTRRRTCACKEGFDFDADEDICSGCGALLPSLLTVLLTLAVLVAVAAEERPRRGAAWRPATPS